MTQLVAFPEGMQYRRALKITDALLISDTESPDKGQPEYTYLEDIQAWLTYKAEENENGFLTGLDLKEIHAWVIKKISANENKYLTLSDIEEIREKLFEQDLSRINAALQNVATAINNTNRSSNNANAKAELASDKANKANDAAVLAGKKTQEAHATIIRLEELGDSLVGQYKAIPKSVTLDYPLQVTIGNTVPQRIKHTLLPVNTGRNVLFLGDNNAVMLSPNGEFTPQKLGISVIHAIPTENTEITKTIQITVVAPNLRRAGSSLRLMGNGNLRLT